MTRYAVVNLDMLEEMIEDADELNKEHEKARGGPSAFHQGRWLAYRFVREEMVVAEL